MPRLGNPFPIRPNTIPINHCIRRHGAIGQEIIIAHPAIRFHDAQCAEAIPRPRDRTPSRRHSAVRAKPIPRRTIVVPARLHRSAVIEEIPLAIDFAPTSRHCAVGIDHPKVSIALDKNRIHVFKRQNINAGTAARLGGLRQSDIRAKKRALAHINAPAHNKPKSSIIRLEIETSIELLPSTMAFRMPKRQLHHCRRSPKYKTWSTLLIVRHDFRAIGNVVINPFCILNFQTHTPGR